MMLVAYHRGLNHFSERRLFDVVDQNVSELVQRFLARDRKHGDTRTNQFGEMVQKYEPSMQHPSGNILEQVVFDGGSNRQAGAHGTIG